LVNLLKIKNNKRSKSKPGEVVTPETGKVEDWLAQHRAEYGRTPYKHDPKFMGPGQRGINQAALEQKHTGPTIHEPEYIVKTQLQHPEAIVKPELKLLQETQLQQQAGVLKTIQLIKPELKLAPVLTTKTKQEIDTKNLLNAKVDTKTKTKQIVKADVKVDTKAITKTLAETKTDTKTLTKAQTKTLTETKTDTKTLTKTITPTVTQTVAKTPAPLLEFPKTPPPVAPVIGLPDLPERGGMAYAVEVRRRGMFQEVGKARTLAKAFLLGKQKVEHTAAASLRVVPLGGNKREGISAGAWSVLGKQKFRKSKTEADVFIQRRSYRISTAGEKGEITKKGLLAIQLGKQKKTKGFNLFGG